MVFKNCFLLDGKDVVARTIDWLGIQSESDKEEGDE